MNPKCGYVNANASFFHSVFLCQRKFIFSSSSVSQFRPERMDLNPALKVQNTNLTKRFSKIHVYSLFQCSMEIFMIFLRCIFRHSMLGIGYSIFNAGFGL